MLNIQTNWIQISHAHNFFSKLFQSSCLKFVLGKVENLKLWNLKQKKNKKLNLILWFMYHRRSILAACFLFNVAGLIFMSKQNYGYKTMNNV